MAFVKTGDGHISTDWIVRFVSIESGDQYRVQYFDGSATAFTLAAKADVDKILNS